MAGGAKAQETSFWKMLRQVQTGPNTLGKVELVNFLALQQGEPNVSHIDGKLEVGKQGKFGVRAAPKISMEGLQTGWTLDLTRGRGGGEDVEACYWLPWQQYAITSVKRAKFESDCNFFITGLLTGCRMTVTPELVMHIANKPAPGDEVGNSFESRTEFETFIGGAKNGTVRLDVTVPSFGFDVVRPHGRSFTYRNTVDPRATGTVFFGIKIGNQWEYKYLKRNPMPGQWVVI